MVNLGIVGMGYIGRIHSEAAQKIPEARILAVATRRPAEVPEACRDATVYASPEDLYRDNRLDAVVICLPTHLHQQAVIAAAEAGRHILCEKPMALDAASAQHMLEAVRASGRIFMVSHVLRFWPQYARLKELIDAGELGEIRSLTAHRLAKYAPWGEWFRDPAKSGGCILDLQVHDIDFIHSLLGHPASVYTVGIQSPNGAWDHVHTTLTYARAQATVEASYLMPAAWPFTTGIYVVGAKGAIEYTFRVGANIQEREQAVHYFRLYKNDGTTIEPEISSEDMFVAQLRYFVHCVAQNQPPRLCPPEESYQVMQVMTASHQSAESGKVIPLITEPPARTK